MKQVTLFCFILICSAHTLLAQIGGESTFQFLNLETSARSAALGGKVVSDFKNDPIAGLNNPAAVNVTTDNNYSANIVNFIDDVTYGSLATAFRIKQTEKLIHVGVTYINYGTFNGFDEIGNSTGTFSAAEGALSIGYATPIPNSDFHFGASFKFISSQFEEFSSLGIATDVGLIYFKEKSNLTIGLSVRNIGFQIKTFAGTNEQIPLEVNLGISKTLSKAPIKWYVSLQNLQKFDLAFANENQNITNLLSDEVEEDDPSFFNNVFRHVNLGVEFFPKSAFNLRVGYNFRRSEELKLIDERSLAGFSGGFGLRIRKLKFDYTFVRFNSAASSSLFGIKLNLGDSK